MISTELWLTSVQWTLATTFDLQGWFRPKLGLAVALLCWTLRFIYYDEVELDEAGRKGVNYFEVLMGRLRSDPETAMVSDIFL